MFIPLVGDRFFAAPACVGAPPGICWCGGELGDGLGAAPGCSKNTWGFPARHGGTPMAGWLTAENPIQMDDLGEHLFGKPPTIPKPQET